MAIRLDNPPNSSRWYPGGGIYRNVWLTKTAPVYVAHWGTFITTPKVSKELATIDLQVSIVNDTDQKVAVTAVTQIYELDETGKRLDKPVETFDSVNLTVSAISKETLTCSIELKFPRLWGPRPSQTPNLYLAETAIIQGGEQVDRFETRFGIRDIEFDPNSGILVNDELIHIQGANQHHDLGALGAAFNVRAAERQLEILQEMGCNAIRMSHNPPAPELLELTDRMGFLVIDEIFDIWERKKSPLDSHLIFPEWHEQDLRALVRRDRNHPSVILWSVGNEVGEQYLGENSDKVAKRLNEITKQEDPTRLTTTAMNFAKPDTPLSSAVDVTSLNYQGEGIRNAPAYKGFHGITTPPLFSKFHKTHHDKVIISSENAAAFSSRGEYFFPVHKGSSAPYKKGQGGDSQTHQVCGYELYTTPFGSSADKVFKSLESNPYVAGGFVWSGWDYLGEPTPFYDSRSSYFGVIDLAGFRKNRFYLYQALWKPETPLAHILPHWNWPKRVGKVTPVHIFTSGDEAELFLNGKSLGRKKKKTLEYRLRWDDVVYEPGKLKVVAYKDGKRWIENSVETTESPAKLVMMVDRSEIDADGNDLAFITVRIADENDLTVPTASNKISFSVEGPAEIIATDNGDSTNMTSFASHERKAFNGLCLAIVRSIPGQSGTIIITAQSDSLESKTVTINSQSVK